MPIRKSKWEKQRKPHYTNCLRCDLACTMLESRQSYKFNIFTCPRIKKGEVIFQDEWERLKNEYEESLKKKGLHRVEEQQAYFI